MTARRKTDFLEEQTRLAPESEKANPIFKQQLQRLAEFISVSRTATTQPPSIFNRGFEAVCLEREKMQPAYPGDRIRVARWRLTDDSRRLFDLEAIDQLVSCLIEPWKDAETFRIEFQIYQIKDKPTYFDVQALAEITGRIDATKGRSASALWEIRWNKNLRSTGEYQIDRIRMLGHEEILSYVENGQLFQDCTASVLQHDQALIRSLGHGMDTWARMIPGTDVLGNNGLAVGDVNGDGLDDLYVCQPHGLPNLLLVQNPDGTADNVAVDCGVGILDHSYAALIVDLDNDRDQDLVVATDQALVLLSNTGSGKFQTEHQLRIGLGTESLSAVDVDQDGDLDLMLCKYHGIRGFNDIFAKPDQLMAAENGGRNVLLRNDEAWNFVDVTELVGLASGNQRFSRAAVWSDFDADGDLDLYVANDFHHDGIYENQDGWLRDRSEYSLKTQRGRHTSVSAGEFNKDRKPDFFVGSDTSFEAATCVNEYLDMGGRFSTEAQGFESKECLWFKPTDYGTLSRFDFQPPIFAAQSCYSSVVADLNNDSLDDILVTNGWLTRFGKGNIDSLFFNHVYRVPAEGNELDRPPTDEFQHEISDLCRSGYSYSGFQRNRCFLGMGNMRFANFSAGSGFDFLDDGRAVATTDWDWDGDLDVVLTCRTSPRFRILLNNIRSRNRYMAIDLVGTKSNCDAIGSRVELYLAGQNEPVVKTLTAGSGRASQSSKRLHFGLGQNDTIEKVIVYWPNGQSEEFNGLRADTIYSIVEGQGEAAEVTNQRFKLALEPKAIEQTIDPPDVPSAVFYPPSRLPILEFQGHENKWFPVEPLKDMPMVAMFCSLDDSSIQLLTTWREHYRQVVEANVDFLPLFINDGLSDKSFFAKVEDNLKKIDFPFRWGVVSTASRDKLQMMCGEWFFDQSLASTEPLSILVDPKGSVCRAYHGDQLRWFVVQQDVQEVMESFNKDLVSKRPKNGLWIARFRTPWFDRIQSRFDSIGYQQDASRFADGVKYRNSYELYQQAAELASQGNLYQAANFAQRSLDLNSQSVDALIVAALIAEKQAAVADAQHRIQLLRAAGKQLDRAIELDSNNSEAFIARANIFQALDDVDHAIKLLRSYLKIDPENWQVHAIIGRMLIDQKEYVAATEFLIKAYENRPTLPNVAGQLGLLYLSGGQFEEAKKFLRLANRQQPSDVAVIKRLSEAEFWVGNFDKAGDLFRQSVELEPREKELKYYLAWLLATSPFESQRDGYRGLELMATFFDLYGNESATVIEIQAACLAETGRFEDAEALQIKALELVESRRSQYTTKQLDGLKARIELYRRSKPYRMSDVRQIPIKPPGVR